MATKSQGLVAQRIWLAAHVYARIKTGKLSITSDSLEFNYGRGRTVLPLADMKEIDLDIRPNVGLVWLADFVRWFSVLWWRTSHWHYLSIRSSSGWIHFRFVWAKDRNKLLEELLKLPSIRLRGAISTVEN